MATSKPGAALSENSLLPPSLLQTRNQRLEWEHAATGAGAGDIRLG